MRVKEELRTFSNDAHELALKLILAVDDVSLERIPAAESAATIDRLARDMKRVTDCLKDLAYRLGRGDDRVSTIPFPVAEIPGLKEAQEVERQLKAKNEEARS